MQQKQKQPNMLKDSNATAGNYTLTQLHKNAGFALLSEWKQIGALKVFQQSRIPLYCQVRFECFPVQL